MKPLTGGTPITYELARDLRRVVYGSSVHTFSRDWKHSTFRLHELDSPFPWGLVTQTCGSRGLLLSVQAFIIKHLVFKYSSREAISCHNVLKPSNMERRNALINALSDILWKAGELRSCIIALPHDKEIFSATSECRKDGITEKLYLYEFTSLKDTQDFIKKHIGYFDHESTNGCVLFLFSLALSRTLKRIQEDAGPERVQLLTDAEECSQELLNLLLTGRAVRYIHNQDILYDLEGALLSHPEKGVAERSDIGFLYWHKDEDDRKRTKVGSMYKTPKKPIWLTRINGNHFGLLFGTNPDLVSDWRTEHMFTLHYYTGLDTQTRPTQLRIDTRFERRLPGRTAQTKKDEEKKIPALEQCIMTKWTGALVDWGGQTPFL